MIVIASGHARLQDYVRHRWPGQTVATADDWESVLPLLPQCRAIFLGSRLPGLFPIRSQTRDALLHAGEVVIWLSPEDRGRLVGFDGEAPVQCWEGAIDPGRLERWVEHHLAPEVAFEPAPEWALYAMAGNLPRLDLLTRMIRQSRRLYGAGTAVDLAWHDPQLTFECAPPSHFKSGAAGRPLLLRTGWGRLLAAPPPWALLEPWPSRDSLWERCRQVSPATAWTGFDFGSSLRTPPVADVLPSVQQLVVMGPSGDWEATAVAVIEQVRLLAKDVPIVVVCLGEEKPWMARLGANVSVHRFFSGDGAETVNREGESRWAFFKKIGIQTRPARRFLHNRFRRT